MHAILRTAREHQPEKRVEWDRLVVSPRYNFNPLPSSGGWQIITPCF
jgi:hypothetical protein